MAAWRRECSVSVLASVIMCSTSGRTAFAFGTVVTTRSASMMLVARLRKSASRPLVVRLSLYPAYLCLMRYSLSSAKRDTALQSKYGGPDTGPSHGKHSDPRRAHRQPVKQQPSDRPARPYGFPIQLDGPA